MKVALENGMVEICSNRQPSKDRDIQMCVVWKCSVLCTLAVNLNCQKFSNSQKFLSLFGVGKTHSHNAKFVAFEGSPSVPIRGSVVLTRRSHIQLSL
jgi:hypothetical protein